MINKKMAALLAVPVSALLVIAGTQSSIGAFAATGIEGEAVTDVTTSASADSILQCAWRIGGVASTVALANTDPELEYVGSEYALVGSDEGIKIFLSGDATESTRCSFYNDYKGAQVKVSWDGTAFTSSTVANPSDTSLSWNVSEKALGIAYTDADCAVDWVTEDALTISDTFTAGSEIKPAAILATSVDTSAEYNPSAKTGSTFPSCGFSASFSTAIPSNKTPNNPGAQYSFTGPELTTTLVLEP
jgi:hypothetical protein